MTTSITVKAHAWPVEITTTDHVEGVAPVPLKETVPPGSERTVYIHQTRTASFRELPLPDSSE